MRYSQAYSTSKVAARSEAQFRSEFRHVGRSAKITCIACGRSGYPGGSWMDPCLAGHARCWCGRLVPTKTLLMHQSHRTHPKREEPVTDHRLVRVVQGHVQRYSAPMALSEYHEWVRTDTMVYADRNGVQHPGMYSAHWHKWECNNPDCAAFAFVNELAIADLIEQETRA